MDEHTLKLKTYIEQQLQSGQSSDAIANQLRAANWPENYIQQAFLAIQQQIMPSAVPPVAQTNPGLQMSQEPHNSEASGLSPRSSFATPQTNGMKRGRIRTGWRLFKQSMQLLNGNRYLLRYMIMTGVWVFGITAVMVAVYLTFNNVLYKDSSANTPTVLGYILGFIDYVLIYFFINLYAAGLTSNVFDLFRGNRKPYHEYMRIAWSKAGAILMFSIIAATVGMFLQYIAERIRVIGWLIAWLLQTAWSLGTLFVIPIIVSSEKPSGISSIKQSMQFFKETWGENITAKVSINLPLMLINIAFIFVFVLLIAISAASGVSNFGVIIALLCLYWVVAIAIAIVGSFANSLVNIALYYFATQHEVPPAFDEELLNKVFIKKSQVVSSAKSRLRPLNDTCAN